MISFGEFKTLVMEGNVDRLREHGISNVDVHLTTMDEEHRLTWLQYVARDTPKNYLRLLDFLLPHMPLDHVKGAIFYAASVKNAKIRRSLLTALLHRINVILDKTNMTDEAIKIQCLVAAADGNMIYMFYLLQKYHDPFNIDVNLDADEGNTPLICAADNGRKHTVYWLLQHPLLKVNKSGDDGRTALMLSSANGYEKIVQWLIQHRADVNKHDNDGMTALMLSSANGHEKIVQWLIQHRADGNEYDNDGMTALMFAAANGHGAVVRLLLEGEPDLTDYDDDDNTALILAAANGHEGIVDQLLKCRYDDVDMEAKDKDGHSALACAAISQHLSIVKRLTSDQRCSRQIIDAAFNSFVEQISTCERFLTTAHWAIVKFFFVCGSLNLNNLNEYRHDVFMHATLPQSSNNIMKGLANMLVKYRYKNYSGIGAIKLLAEQIDNTTTVIPVEGATYDMKAEETQQSTPSKRKRIDPGESHTKRNRTQKSSLTTCGYRVFYDTRAFEKLRYLLTAPFVDGVSDTFTRSKKRRSHSGNAIPVISFVYHKAICDTWVVYFKNVKKILLTLAKELLEHTKSVECTTPESANDSVVSLLKTIYFITTFSAKRCLNERSSVIRKLKHEELRCHGVIFPTVKTSKIEPVIKSAEKLLYTALLQRLKLLDKFQSIPEGCLRLHK